jgi:hypothetical protein
LFEKAVPQKRATHLYQQQPPPPQQGPPQQPPPQQQGPYYQQPQYQQQQQPPPGYGYPQQPPPGYYGQMQPRRNSCTPWIIGALVLVLLCCGGCVVAGLAAGFGTADWEVITGDEEVAEDMTILYPSDWRVVDDFSGDNSFWLASNAKVADMLESGSDQLDDLDSDDFAVLVYYEEDPDASPARMLRTFEDDNDPGVEYGSVNTDMVFPLTDVARLSFDMQSGGQELDGLYLFYEDVNGMFQFMGLAADGEADALEDYVVALARYATER